MPTTKPFHGMEMILKLSIRSDRDWILVSENIRRVKKKIFTLLPLRRGFKKNLFNIKELQFSFDKVKKFL